MVLFNLYVVVYQFKLFEGNIEIVLGICVIFIVGYMLGYMFFVVESKGQKLMIWGDLVYVQVVQFDQFLVIIYFDSDLVKVEVECKVEFVKVVKQGYLVGVVYIVFLGLGYVCVKGYVYEWVLVNYINIC